MTTGLSTNGESVILAALMTGRYISLHTGDPANNGANEAAGGSYARQAQGSWSVSGGNPSIISNDALIEFPVATALWGSVSYFGVWSASSGGTFYGGYALTTAKTIDVDDIARFPAGVLQISSD